MLVFCKASVKFTVDYFLEHKANKCVYFLLRCIGILTFTIIRICQFVEYIIIVLTNFKIFHCALPPRKIKFIYQLYYIMKSPKSKEDCGFLYKPSRPYRTT